MGSGIAEAVAVAGVPVVVRDVDAQRSTWPGSGSESLARAVSRGKLSAEEAAATRAGSR